MKTYHDILQFLFSKNSHVKAEYKLERCLQLYRALGNPQHRFPSVHIAGTNGKGSVAVKIAKAFELSGLRAGLYTSPHISTYRERIQINSSLIGEEELVSLINEVHATAGTDISFFEITTAAAFLHFARNNVDIAIIETGLGGRLDATNALDTISSKDGRNIGPNCPDSPRMCQKPSPLLSIITSISFDHTQILGNTLELIAKEKAGILVPGVTALVGPSVPLSTIAHHTPLIQVTDPSPNSIAREALVFLSQHYPQIKNHITHALAIDPPCRFEVIHTDSSTVVLDIAHNPASIHNLFTRMKQRFPGRKYQAVMALSKTKDLASCLRNIPLEISRLIMTQSENGRCFSAETLYQEAMRYGFSHLDFTPDPKEALKQALSSDFTVVFGSFFIMSEIRKALGIKEICDLIDMNEHINQTPDKMTIS